MKHLHSYWRMEYIQAQKDPEPSNKPRNSNPFAELYKNPDDKAAHIVHRGKLTLIILNKFPYNPGHLLILPYREVPTLPELTQEERSELMANIILGQQILEEAIQPQGFNIGFNIGPAAGAGIPRHLHAHIVPRWEGDTNFMPVIGDTRVLPESMDRMWTKLHATAKELYSRQ
jgi:ATP adenylyltransferase